MGTIAGWSQADLRRYIVNLLLSDPGALPRSATKSQPELARGTPGQGLVWDGQAWVPSSATVYNNSSGASSFLQLLTSAQRKVNFGTVSFTFTASAVSAAQSPAHGLGTTPSLVLLQSATSSNFLGSNVSVVGATTFTANSFVTANTAISGTFVFYWLAIA